jgi:predicted naringenin-chalcone synthase
MGLSRQRREEIARRLKVVDLSHFDPDDPTWEVEAYVQGEAVMTAISRDLEQLVVEFLETRFTPLLDDLRTLGEDTDDLVAWPGNMLRAMAASIDEGAGAERGP